MEFVIWNRIETDKIDVVLSKDVIKVFIDGKEHWVKKIQTQEDLKIYEQILDDIEKINEMYINKDEEKFQKLSEEFLQKLKVL